MPDHAHGIHAVPLVPLAVASARGIFWWAGGLPHIGSRFMRAWLPLSGILYSQASIMGLLRCPPLAGRLAMTLPGLPSVIASPFRVSREGRGIYKGQKQKKFLLTYRKGLRELLFCRALTVSHSLDDGRSVASSDSIDSTMASANRTRSGLNLSVCD